MAMARLNLEHLKRSIPSNLIYSVFRLIGDHYNHKLLNQYLDRAPGGDRSFYVYATAFFNKIL